MFAHTKKITVQNYWSWETDFYDFRDNFVKNWFKTRPKNTDELELAFSFLGGLCLDALPEPYIGSHKNARAVVVNYNPGLSEPEDYSKFVSQQMHKEGTSTNLIKSFKEECLKSYKKFSRKWNPLTAVDDIPGRSWWKVRFQWIKRMCDAFQLRSQNGGSVTESEVFGLELCPYHSKNFRLHLPFKKSDESVMRTTLREHILRHVLIPSINVIISNQLPCLICIGAQIGQYLGYEYEAIVFVEKWSNGKKYVWHDGKWSMTGPCKKWPPKQSCRSYELLMVDLTHSMWGGLIDSRTSYQTIPILVTYTTGSNNVPSEKFLTVEKAFVSRILRRNLKPKKQPKGKKS